MLNITISYKTNAPNLITSECVVVEPHTKSDSDDVYTFFWMLSQSDKIDKFQVRDGSGFTQMPKNYGWVCDKWIKDIYNEENK